MQRVRHLFGYISYFGAQFGMRWPGTGMCDQPEKLSEKKFPFAKENTRNVKLEFLVELKVPNV